MVVRNLTSRVQELKVAEYVGGRVFTLYVEANSCTDLEGMYVVRPQELNGVFEVVNSYLDKVKQSQSDDTVTEVLDPEESHSDDRTEQGNESKESESVDIPADEEKSEDKPEESSTFICDICGAEFASSRGLNSHKNRSHPIENK